MPIGIKLKAVSDCCLANVAAGDNGKKVECMKCQRPCKVKIIPFYDGDESGYHELSTDQKIEVVLLNVQGSVNPFAVDAAKAELDELYRQKYEKMEDV